MTEKATTFTTISTKKKHTQQPQTDMNKSRNEARKKHNVWKRKIGSEGDRNMHS